MSLCQISVYGKYKSDPESTQYKILQNSQTVPCGDKVHKSNDMLDIFSTGISSFKPSKDKTFKCPSTVNGITVDTYKGVDQHNYQFLCQKLKHGSSQSKSGTPWWMWLLVGIMAFLLVLSQFL